MNITDFKYENEQFISRKYNEESDESIIFTKENLPKIPTLLQTDQLIIKRGLGQYGNTYYSILYCFSNKDIYRKIGIILLSLVLNPNNENVVISLTNNESDIKQIIFQPMYHKIDPIYNYKSMPSSFEYKPEPEKLGINPFNQYKIDVQQMPYFNLVKENMEDINNLDELSIANTVIGCSDKLGKCNNDLGTILLAKFLFDFSNEASDLNEIDFKTNDRGWNGVSEGSASIQFHLAGSWRWDNYELDLQKILS